VRAGLERAASALGASELLGADAGWAREEVDAGRRTDALVAVVAGPLVGNAELVRLALSLGGRRGPAPIVALRDRCPDDEATLLLGNGCCDVLDASAPPARDLLSGLRLAFEVARRQRAEAPWLEGDEGSLAWPPPALVEARRLAALGRGFAALTHDLKNLLQPVVGYAELIATEAPPGVASDAARVLAHLAAEAEEILRRSLSRLQAPGGRPHPLRVADALVLAGERLLTAVAGPKVRVWVVPGAPDTLIAVPEGALDQILLNLAANARDAMPEGGVLEVRSALVGAEWVLEVEDSGRGIAAGRLDRLFEPGYVASGSGTGLGLWIVRGLVEELGGSLALASRAGGGGRGTRLIVRLPAYQPSR
jgi:signal transduction histidine kinase